MVWWGGEGWLLMFNQTVLGRVEVQPAVTSFLSVSSFPGSNNDMVPSDSPGRGDE